MSNSILIPAASEVRRALVDAMSDAWPLPHAQQTLAIQALEVGAQLMGEHDHWRKRAASAAGRRDRARAQQCAAQSLDFLRQAQSALREAWAVMGTLEASERAGIGLNHQAVPPAALNLQEALHAHYEHGWPGHGNHGSLQEFTAAWQRLERTLESIPKAGFEAVLAEDVPATALPVLPQAEQRMVSLGVFRERLMFVAPEGPDARSYSEALGTIADASGPLAEVFILSHATFLSRYGTQQFLDFVDCMHRFGRPANVGIFLEDMERPGQGRMFTVGNLA